MGLLDGQPPIPGRLKSGAITLANGNNNNIDPAGAAYITFTGPSGAYALTGLVKPPGIVSPYDRQELYLNFNVNQTLTLSHNSGNSSVGNKITTATGADMVFAAASIVRVHLIYDPTVGGGAGYWVYFGGWDSAGAH